MCIDMVLRHLMNLTAERLALSYRIPHPADFILQQQPIVHYHDIISNTFDRHILSPLHCFEPTDDDHEKSGLKNSLNRDYLKPR